MAYPKPLSEKSIARMYADSKHTEEKIDFLCSMKRTDCHMRRNLVFNNKAIPGYISNGSHC